VDEHLQQAIALLAQATADLQQLVATPTDERTPRSVVDSVKTHLRRVNAELTAAIAPPLNDRVPEKLLNRAASLGIPLDDIEVRVAIASHHPSQLLGILNEIEQRYEQIKRVREYLILRLPDMPIESMGSRLPTYSVEDFDWQEPRLSAAELSAIRLRHGIDGRRAGRVKDLAASHTERLQAAQAQWLAATSSPTARSESPDDEDWTQLPF
jgi:hypothetical protein